MVIAAVTDELATASADDVDEAAIAIAKTNAAHRLRCSLLVVVTIIMLGTGYVLSPAVLITLEKHGVMSPQLRFIAQVLIYPLKLAYENSDLVQSFYAGYFELIGVDE